MKKEYYDEKHYEPKTITMSLKEYKAILALGEARIEAGKVIVISREAFGVVESIAVCTENEAIKIIKERVDAVIFNWEEKNTYNRETAREKISGWRKFWADRGF